MPQVSDLNRLLQTYQFWAHKMYPKTPFNDSVQRIEKLCHGKRMHVCAFYRCCAVLLTGLN